MAQTGKIFRLPEDIDPSWRVGIVYATFYEEEIASMVEGAKQCLEDAGIASANITLHPVLGSFEVPLIGAALADAGNVDALIGLGIILEGETRHADHLAREVARAMMDIQLQYKMPFAYEVLHVHSLEQAKKRSEGEANKGKEAACAVLHSLAQLKKMRS